MRDKDKTYIWLLPTSTCRFRSARPPGSTALALVRLSDIGAACDVVWLKLGHLGASDDRCCMTKDWSGVTDTRWTYMSWSPCSCFTHSMTVFARFCRWFYVAFLQTFWGIRHSPAQLHRGFRQLHIKFVRLLFLQAHRETDRFFAASGVVYYEWIKRKLKTKYIWGVGVMKDYNLLCPVQKQCWSDSH